MKRIRKISLWALGIITLLFLLLLIFLQTSWFQTWATNRIASYLEGELNTKIEVGAVDIEWFTTLVLKDFKIEDQSQNSLAEFSALKVNGFRKIDQQFLIDNIQLESPRFHLRKYLDSTSTNIQFLVDYFNQPKDSSRSFTLDLEKFALSDGLFEYTDFQNDTAVIPGQINMAAIRLEDLNIEASECAVLGDSLNLQINAISCADTSGFLLENLAGHFTMNSTQMNLDQAQLIVADSYWQGQLEMNFKDWNAFKRFNKKVKLEVELDSCEIATKDVAYFAPALAGLDEKLVVQGTVKGRVSNLLGKDLNIQWTEDTRFKGNISLNGLPEIDQTFITLDVEELQTNAKDMARIPLPPFEEDKFLQVLPNVYRMGQVKFSGNFTGFINDFAAYGDLNSALGYLRADLSLNDSEAGLVYNGTLKTRDFNIGKFYGIQQMGKVFSDVHVVGKGLRLADIDAKVDGTISSFDFNDYTYSQVTIDGELREEFFDGILEIRDENANIDFEGKVDLSGNLPSYSFVADVNHINLVELNFLEIDNYSALSTKVRANAVGSNLDNIVGDIYFEDISYCAHYKECSLDFFSIHSEKTEGLRRIETASSIFTGTLTGEYDFKDLPYSAELILEALIPSYEIEHKANHKQQDFVLDFRIHDFQVIQDFFLPDVYLAPDTRLHLLVNEKQNDFELNSTADRLELFGRDILGLTLDSRRADSTLFFTLMADNMELNEGIHLEIFSLDGRSEGDTIYTSLEWQNDNEGHSGELTGTYLIRGARNFDYYFDQSLINVKDNTWYFNDHAWIEVDSTDFMIHDFQLYQGEQSLQANGLISKNPDSQLDILLSALDLVNFNPWIPGGKMTLQGELNGELSLKDVSQDRLIFSNLGLSDFIVNDKYIGNITMNSSWDQINKRVIASGELIDQGTEPIKFGGYYLPLDKESPLDFNADIDGFKLDFLNALIQENVSDIGGNITGDIRITGSPQAPILEGLLAFDDAHLTIDYLNTTYYLNDQVGVYQDMFTVDNILVNDEEGNTARAIGTILHDNFKEWNFDVYLDTENKDFLCLNTNQSMNSLYYGKAYGNGYLNAFGYTDKLELDIHLKTGAGTNIAMPLGDSEEVAFEDFVTFVDRNAPLEVEEELDLTGIKLNFDLEILPAANFQIIFDEAIGDVIEGNGSGLVNMKIDTRGTFEMFGSVNLHQGDYLFTLKNLINKNFEVIPGGKISWYGDPMAAELDLQTVYKLSAPLYDLLGDVDASYKNRTQVDLLMNLDGELLQPNIDFDIETPNVDEITKGRVRSAINSEDETNRQAFALIALRRFVSPPNISAVHSNSILAENSSEFISNQLSNWLSQISNDFDLGINYRPGDEITNQEIAIALSTQLFNDRLSLSGNFGVSQGSDQNQNPSSLIGDVRIEYKVLEDGRIRLLMFNRSNDFDIASTNQNASTQGAGLLYREDFNNLSEFYCGFKNLFKPAGDREPCE